MSDYEKVLLLSALSHLVYCKRRYYLAYVEGLEQKNAFVELGTELHEQVHQSTQIRIPNGYSLTNYTVYSKKYGLFGICDMIEFLHNDDGCDVDFLNGRFELVPIEHKIGRVRHSLEYMIQVTGQAMCLEEMFHCHISRGGIYFIEAKERFDFDITDYHRRLVKEALSFVKDYDYQVILPKYQKRCKNCSLFSDCNPKGYHLSQYLNALWEGE